MTPRTGRPRLEHPRTKAVHIRFTPDEHQTMTDAAARAGQTLGAWMRHQLLKAAKRSR